MEELDEIKELEKRKLQLEIKQLNKTDFKKIYLPVFVQIFATLLIAVGSLFIAYRNVLTDAKEKNQDTREKIIDAKTKNLELAIKQDELTKKNEELDQETKELEIRKEQIKDTTEKLSNQRDEMSRNLVYSQKENHRLKKESDYLATTIKKNEINLSKLEDSLGRAPFLTVLSSIDSLSNFNCEDNKPLYRQLEDKMQIGKNNNRIAEITDDYINNQSKPLVNRLNVLAAAYHNLNNSNGWMIKYQNLMQGSICEKQIQNSYTKTISSKIWNNSEYHLTIKNLLENSPKQDCRENLFNLVNRLTNNRKDDLLSADQDYASFLNYLILYRENVTREFNLNIFITKISVILRLKQASMLVVKIYLSEYFVLNKDLFDQYIRKQLDEKNKNPRSSTYVIKQNAEKINISEEDFVSIDFWNRVKTENSQLHGRLMENDFSTYKKDKATLAVDMKAF